MKRLQFCLAVFAVLALSFCAFAQVQNSEFVGTVTDQTGAAIANAKVTVMNPATNLSITTTTNSSGNYTVKEIPVGTYKLTVEAPGFKTYNDNGVTANAGTISHVDVKLQVGKASELVEVTGEAAIVATDDSKLSITVNSTQISNLPLNGRNVFDLMAMSTGAVNVKGVDGARAHCHQIENVAAIQGQVADLCRVHGDGQLGIIGSDNRRLARDLDKLRSLPDLEFHVDVRDGAGVRSHPVVVESLEARSLNRQLVSADWNLLHGIVTAGIGRGGDVQVGCGVHNRNLGVRDGGTGLIGHGTDELAILNLREGAEA